MVDTGEIWTAIAKKEFLRLIDEIERENWDCNSPCGVVNRDSDVCKICGNQKELSWDNSKLEKLKKRLEGISKEDKSNLDKLFSKDKLIELYSDLVKRNTELMKFLYDNYRPILRELESKQGSLQIHFAGGKKHAKA